MSKLPQRLTSIVGPLGRMKPFVNLRSVLGRVEDADILSQYEINKDPAEALRQRKRIYAETARRCETELKKDIAALESELEKIKAGALFDRLRKQPLDDNQRSTLTVAAEIIFKEGVTAIVGRGESFQRQAVELADMGLIDSKLIQDASQRIEMREYSKIKELQTDIDTANYVLKRLQRFIREL